MDKQFLDFLNHNTNACNPFLIRNTERNGNYEKWTIKFDDVPIEIWVQVKTNKSVNPKHTGGKPSYTKIMTNAIIEHKLSVEAAGLLTLLSIHIDWHTGLLLHRRTKKSLLIDDMCTILDKSKPFIIKTLKELKTKELLTKTKEGYKISREILQKGAKTK